MKHLCPVCGFPELTEPPRSKSGGGSYEICPSCGYQFGVDDDDKRIPFATARETWVAGGMRWRSSTPPPRNWKPAEQLQALVQSETAPRNPARGKRP